MDPKGERQHHHHYQPDREIDQTGQHRGQDRDAHCKQQHVQIEIDLIHARQVVAAEANDQVNQPVRQQHATSAAQSRVSSGNAG